MKVSIVSWKSMSKLLTWEDFGCDSHQRLSYECVIVYVVYVWMEATTTMYLVQESFEGRIVWRMGRWEDLKKEFEVHSCEAGFPKAA